MCKVGEQEFCVVLGADSNKWSKYCPLDMPSFFDDAVESFSRAVSELARGNRKESLEALSKCNAAAVGKFFIEHGQQSAYFRVTNRQEIDDANRLNKKVNPSPRDSTPAMTKEVFKRDFYRCRYCSLRIITSEVFSEYSRIVGSAIFSIERENAKRNGLTLGLRGVADHVEPHALGAATEIDNLVTSCYSCNFGKAGYTLDQLKIQDPRLRQPKDDGWKGLTNFLPALKLIS
jgi:5-methylcytosine-specific restriction endonuclease McrA